MNTKEQQQKNSTKKNNANKFALNCDWLQLFVKARTDFFEIENPWSHLLPDRAIKNLAQHL